MLFKGVVTTSFARLVFRFICEVELFASDLSTFQPNGTFRYFLVHFADQCFERRHIGGSHRSMVLVNVAHPSIWKQKTVHSAVEEKPSKGKHGSYFIFGLSSSSHFNT